MTQQTFSASYFIIRRWGGGLNGSWRQRTEQGVQTGTQLLEERKETTWWKHSLFQSQTWADVRYLLSENPFDNVTGWHKSPWEIIHVLWRLLTIWGEGDEVSFPEGVVSWSWKKGCRLGGADKQWDGTCCGWSADTWSPLFCGCKSLKRVTGERC